MKSAAISAANFAVERVPDAMPDMRLASKQTRPASVAAVCPVRHTNQAVLWQQAIARRRSQIFPSRSVGTTGFWTMNNKSSNTNRRCARSIASRYGR